ncbi:MAG: hypothetical protein V1836_04535 [Candidatus Aenigmatarchaeota archaeon]
MKIGSNLLMAVFMGATMLVSLIGFAVLQASPLTTGSTATTTLPKSNIIDYLLAPDQQQTLESQYGRTVIEFIYDSQNCTKCGQIIPLLEALANQFNDQVILSEVKASKSDYVDLPRLAISSQIGQWSAKGDSIDTATIEQGFCRIVLYPPIGCTLKPTTATDQTNGTNST